jgi:uncharacterized Zn-finger protein
MDIHLLVRPAAAESRVADFLLSLASSEHDEPMIALSSTPAAAKVIVQEGEARPFKCNWPGGCSYTATRRRYIGEHQRTHTGIKPHKCTYPGCGYSAAGTGHLHRHMRVHTGERPFPCDWPGCGYASSQPSHLTTHKRKHTGDKPYSCPEPGCECARSTVHPCPKSGLQSTRLASTSIDLGSITSLSVGRWVHSGAGVVRHATQEAALSSFQILSFA